MTFIHEFPYCIIFVCYVSCFFINYLAKRRLRQRIDDIFHKSKVSNTTLGPKFLWKSKSFTKPTFRIRTAISGRLSTSSRQGASDAALKTLKTETSKNKNSGFVSIDFQEFPIFYIFIMFFWTCILAKGAGGKEYMTYLFLSYV